MKFHILILGMLVNKIIQTGVPISLLQVFFS